MPFRSRPHSLVSCKRDNDGGNNPPPPKPTFTMQKGVHYSDEIGVYSEEERKETTAIFNKDVFYRNDNIKIGADPSILYVSDETDPEFGKYYLFGTMGSAIFNSYSSYDLTSWELDSAVYAYAPDSWEFKDTFAPEFIWDKDADRAKYGLDEDDPGKGVYFMFFSSSNSVEYRVETNGGQDFQDYLSLAISTRPGGPYKMWTGVETGAVIGGVDYGTADAYKQYTNYSDVEDLDEYSKTNYVARKGDKVDNDDHWFNPAAARASLAFQYKNKENAGKVVDGTFVNEAAKGVISDESVFNFECIDPTPFVDPVTGTKYLYLARISSGFTGYMDDVGQVMAANTIFAVTFIDNDWSQIDYSSLRRVTRNQYNFVNDYDAEVCNQQAAAFDHTKYPKGVKETEVYTFQKNTAENYVSARGLNEGPFVVYNQESGLYYLTTSTGTYVNNSYTVITAVGYTPFGPFRKLEINEGGILLTTNSGAATDLVTGPGHHYMLKVGGEDYIIYHRHIDLTKSQYTRGAVIDKLEWIKNDTGMLVPYVNGPTTTLQPQIYGMGAGYVNIADQAKVTVSTSQDKAKYLNDNLIKIHSDGVTPFIKEYTFTESEATLTLTFDDYRDIAAIMVYNSYNFETAFEKIKKIEMDVKKDGVEGVAIINDLQFPWDMSEQIFDDMMRAGSAAHAVFDEIAVKEIRITIDNWNNYEGFSGITAISEIYVLGKNEVNKNTGNGNATSFAIDNYVDSSIKQPIKKGDITLDGIATEEEWGNKNKFTHTTSIGGQPHDIEASSTFTDDGLIMYFKVSGAPVFFNPGRSEYHNTGVEVYFASSSAKSLYDNAFQMEFFPNGFYNVTKYLKAGKENDPQYFRYYVPGIINTGSVDGVLNSSDSNGYTVEFYIPFKSIGINEVPEAMSINAAVIYCTTYEGDQREAWADIGPTSNPGYKFALPSTWWKFDNDGYYDPNATIKSTINDGEPIQNGTVTVEGSYNNGGKVVVTPNEGYALKSFTVNGEEVNFLEYYFDEQEFLNLDIDVEFKPISGEERILSINSGFAYGLDYPVKNIPIYFKSSDGDLYSGYTDQDGKITINILDGEYIASVYGGNAITVNIDETVNSIKFARNVLESISVDGYAISENGVNGASVKYTGGAVPTDTVPKISFNKTLDLDTVFIDATIVVPTDGNDTFIPIKIIQIGDTSNAPKYYYINVGIWNNIMYVKPFNSTSGQIKISTATACIGGSIVNAYQARVGVMVINNDDQTSTVSLYYHNGASWTHMASANGGYASELCLLTPGSCTVTGPFEINSIKIYNDQDVVSNYLGKIKYDGVTGAKISAKTDYIAPNNKLNVTVTPDSVINGVNIVSSVKVNGVEVPTTLNSDGSASFDVTHDTFSKKEYVIEVSTKSVALKTISLTVRADDALYNGTLKYKGVTFGEVNVINGVASLNLAENIYEFYTDNHLPYKVSIDSTTLTANVILRENIFTASSYGDVKIYGGKNGIDIEYVGGAIAPADTPQVRLLQETVTDFIIDYTIIVPLTSKNTWIPFKIYGKQNSFTAPQYYYFNAGFYKASAVQLKPLNQDTGAVAVEGLVDTDGDSVNDAYKIKLRAGVKSNGDGSVDFSMYYHNGTDFVFVSKYTGPEPRYMAFLTGSADIKGSFAIRDIVIVSK